MATQEDTSSFQKHGRDEEEGSNRKKCCKETEVDDRQYHITCDEDVLLAKVSADLEEDKDQQHRFYFACNTLAAADFWTVSWTTLAPDRPLLLVTPHTLEDEDVQAFLKDPNHECLRWHAMVVSPLRRSGFSSEPFVNGQPYFSHIIGSYRPGGCLPTDFSQMLWRVRDLRPTTEGKKNVYLSVKAQHKGIYQWLRPAEARVWFHNIVQHARALNDPLGGLKKATKKEKRQGKALRKITKEAAAGRDLAEAHLLTREAARIDSPLDAPPESWEHRRWELAKVLGYTYGELGNLSDREALEVVNLDLEGLELLEFVFMHPTYWEEWIKREREPPLRVVGLCLLRDSVRDLFDLLWRNRPVDEPLVRNLLQDSEKKERLSKALKNCKAAWMQLRRTVLPGGIFPSRPFTSLVDFTVALGIPVEAFEGKAWVVLEKLLGHFARRNLRREHPIDYDWKWCFPIDLQNQKESSSPLNAEETSHEEHGLLDMGNRPRKGLTIPLSLRPTLNPNDGVWLGVWEEDQGTYLWKEDLKVFPSPSTVFKGWVETLKEAPSGTKWSIEELMNQWNSLNEEKASMRVSSSKSFGKILRTYLPSESFSFSRSLENRYVLRL